MFQDIQLYIKESMDKVHAYIYQSLQKEDSSIRQFIDYLLKQQGKQIRPQLVLNVAAMLGERITEKTLRGAALVAILHHASLIHDDVIDEATSRRHIQTFNARWDNKLAVLFGDYLLASMLRIAVENRDYDYLSVLTKTAQAMSEGEIAHLTKIDDLPVGRVDRSSVSEVGYLSVSGVDHPSVHEVGYASVNELNYVSVSESDYLHIIQKKTASLLGAACAIGALSVAASSTQVEALYAVGEHVGMAFQLRDDLLDYKGVAVHTGKAPFMDLKEKKLTLPLIYALQQASSSESQMILHNICHPINDTETFQQVGAFVHRLGGMEYTLKKMLDYQKKALEIVENKVSPSVARDAFCMLIQEMLQV